MGWFGEEENEFTMEGIIVQADFCKCPFEIHDHKYKWVQSAHLWDYDYFRPDYHMPEWLS